MQQCRGIPEQGSGKGLILEEGEGMGLWHFWGGWIEEIENLLECK